MTSSLLRLKGRLASQIRRLGRSNLWETERTTATCLLGKRTRVTALCRKRNILHPTCSSVSLHPIAQWCFWSGSRLGYRLTARDYEAKLADKLVPWIINTFDNHNSDHLSLLCFNRNTFDMLSVTVVPQHTHHIECNISCKSKISPSVRKICNRHSRQTPTDWTMPSGRILRPGRAMYTSPKHYRPQNICRPGMDDYE